MEDAVRRMESISGAMNGAGMALVSIVMGWVVMGTFAMQEQITAVLM